MESLDTNVLDYNYTNLELVDMRYRGDVGSGYYLLAFKDKKTSNIISPVNINSNIFESVLKKYCTPLFFNKITREEVMKLKWDARLSEGEYYIWNPESNRYNVKEGKAGRIYVSRLDVSGELSDQTYTN
jgi:hypothetical protein